MKRYLIEINAVSSDGEKRSYEGVRKMKRYLIEINAVSSDGEKRSYEHTVEAESIVDALNKFDQTLDAAEIRRFIKNGYCNLSCHWTCTKGTEPPASDSSS